MRWLLILIVLTLLVQVFASDCLDDCKSLGRSNGVIVDQHCYCSITRLSFTNHTMNIDSTDNIDNIDNIRRIIYPIIKKCPQCKDGVSNINCFLCENMTIVDCYNIYNHHMCNKLKKTKNTCSCNSTLCDWTSSSICCAQGHASVCTCYNHQASCSCR